MTTTIRTERRKRGIFGWIFLLLFWLFNLLMLIWLVGGLGANSTSYAQLTTDAEKAGHAIGTAIATGMVLTIWAAGGIILGLMVLLTAGKKVIVETVKE